MQPITHDQLQHRKDPVEREALVISNSGDSPATVRSLERDFSNLGVRSGMTLLVHSSLSSLGWVCGEAVAVIFALEETLGDDGTLVMPTHSGHLSEPSLWRNPPVPESWWEAIRHEMPAYSPDITPTRHMGAVAEAFRSQAGVLRSTHRQVSFSAWGKEQELVTRDHGLNFPLGEKSPLARIYDLDGFVLLLGVTHSNNTSLHLAESRANYRGKAVSKNVAPLLINGVRKWVEFEEFETDDSDFEEIGRDFSSSIEEAVETGNVGTKRPPTKALLMSQRQLVDFGVVWMEKNRNFSGRSPVQG